MDDMTKIESIASLVNSFVELTRKGLDRDGQSAYYDGPKEIGLAIARIAKEVCPPPPPVV